MPRLHGTQHRYQALALIDEVETAVQENWRRLLLEQDIEPTAVDELAACFTPLQ